MSAEPKWTTGPWRINKYGSIGAGPLGHTPIVAYVEPFYGDDKRDGDSSENAQLIAAAPELYEALVTLNQFASAGADYHGSRLREIVHAALAKACGEAQS